MSQVNAAILHADELVADVPAESLVLGSPGPVYNVNHQPEYLKHIGEFHHDVIVEPTDLQALL